MEIKKVTIIIPHKNSAKLLSRLLASIIPNRNIFEVIVVDDCSNNEELELLSKFVDLEKIKFIKLDKPGGAGKARNEALKHVNTQWVMFADADDFFTDSFDKIIKKYLDSDAEIIYFNSTSIYNDTKKLAYRHLRYSRLVTDFIDDAKNEDKLRYFYTPPWSKLISVDLIKKHKIWFDEVIASNDIFFSVKSAHFAKKIEASKEILYTITVSEGSITNTFSLQHFDSKLKTAIRVNTFLKQMKKYEFQQSILYFFFRSHKFGFKCFVNTTFLLVKSRSNFFIGLSKIVHLRKVLNERENKKYLLKKD
jgi:glycosyltransferase involved in cell wall biosynthesis